MPDVMHVTQSVSPTNVRMRIAVLGFHCRQHMAQQREETASLHLNYSAILRRSEESVMRRVASQNVVSMPYEL